MKKTIRTVCRCIVLIVLIFFGTITFGKEVPPSEQEQEVIRIYNAAQEAQNAGRHENALKGFMTVKKHYPDNWRARAKIVQEYSALGRDKERDAEIAALYAFRSALPEEARSDLPFFCREQFTTRKRKLMVFEHFALQGNRAIRYSFVVLDETGERQDFEITLGSYDTTTQIARDTGSISENERLFHLDGYFADGEHRTYAFFKGEPEYDDVQKMVVEILDGKMKAISGMKPASEGAEMYRRK